MGYSHTKTCPVFRRWVTIEDDIEWWVIVTLYIFWHIIVVFFKYRNNVNKTDRHDITEILLKVVLNTIALTL
jgi:hypothetical protein